ncbi:MAG: hypothetical protein ACP5JJ_01515 [Anaerolineae bacterium]
MSGVDSGLCRHAIVGCLHGTYALCLADRATFGCGQSQPVRYGPERSGDGVPQPHLDPQTYRYLGGLAQPATYH